MRPVPWQSRLHVAFLVIGAGAVVVAVVLLVGHARRHNGFSLAADADELVAPMVFAVVAVMGLSTGLLRPEFGTPLRLRLTAGGWTLAFVAALVFSWNLIDRRFSRDGVLGTPVADEAATAAFLEANGADDRYRVPTGVFIQSFEFLNANNVEFTGYVWQRYAKSIPPAIERRVVLAEALDSYDELEVETTDLGDAVVHRWYIHATLRQPYDYRHYPLDRQDIWLRLTHQNDDDGVVLVPDFGAYRDVAPAALAALERQFVYGVWDPSYTTFSYALQEYDTNFGDGTALATRPIPELYFNLGVKRDFLGPLVNHMPLWLAIAVLLFGILILSTTDTQLRERSGFTTFDSLVASSGLLFAAIIDHNQLRQGFDSQQIAYIEVVPFVLYLFIVLVAINALIILNPAYQPFFDYRQNLIPISLFWPAFTGIILVVTWLAFFAGRA